MTDVLAETAGRLQTKILDLIERSSIKIGRSHGRVVWVGPNSWTALDTEGRQLQAQGLAVAGWNGLDCWHGRPPKSRPTLLPGGSKLNGYLAERG